jgi:transposase
VMTINLMIVWRHCRVFNRAGPSLVKCRVRVRADRRGFRGDG